MVERITEQMIRHLRGRRPEHGNIVVWDTDVVGFGVRITARGAVAFVLRYVVDGRERRITLGKHPDLSPAAARDKATRLRGAVAEGRDPLVERETRRRTAITVAEFCDRYLSEHAEPKKRLSSAKEDRRLMNRRIKPALGARRLGDIGIKDIAAVHGELKRTP